MKQTWSLKEKYRQLRAVMLPIFVTQVALFAIALFAAIMSGHAGADDLAGVAIGANIWMAVFTGLNGILIALVPIIAQLLGAREKGSISFKIIQGVYLALAVSALVLLVGYFAVPALLDRMALQPEVRRIAQAFLGAIAYGVAPLFLSTIFRSFVDTLGYTKITMRISLAALPLNLLLNYLLVFGKCGMPRLGGVGAGYASVITYWFILLMFVWVVQRVEPFRSYGVLQRFYRLDAKIWREITRIGVPIGIAIFCETSIFAAIALLMSRFNTLTIAAHQAAINFASLIYMLPLSVAMALTIAVGFETGAGRSRDAKQYAYLGLGLSLFVGGICALLLVLYGNSIARIYSEDPAVIELTGRFLLYAAFFQLSDAVATPVQGILRGYKDVNVTFLVTIAAYWFVGLPLGHYLALQPAYGAYGYWLGVIIGLALGALCLLGRLLLVQRRQHLAKKEERGAQG